MKNVFTSMLIILALSGYTPTRDVDTSKQSTVKEVP